MNRLCLEKHFYAMYISLYLLTSTLCCLSNHFCFVDGHVVLFGCCRAGKWTASILFATIISIDTWTYSGQLSLRCVAPLSPNGKLIKSDHSRKSWSVKRTGKMYSSDSIFKWLQNHYQQIRKVPYRGDCLLTCALIKSSIKVEYFHMYIATHLL